MHLRAEPWSNQKSLPKYKADPYPELKFYKVGFKYGVSKPVYTF